MIQTTKQWEANKETSFEQRVPHSCRESGSRLRGVVLQLPYDRPSEPYRRQQRPTRLLICPSKSRRLFYE